ncbi:MAG TPA: hypothetical protein VF188_17345 [Longimicrobiales bacterium]
MSAHGATPAPRPTAERRRDGSVEDAPIAEHHLTVSRTARYATLGDPDGPFDQIWFVCHGYRQLAARFIRRFLPLADGTRLIVAPEALNRFYVGDPDGVHGPGTRVGGTWMTREDRQAEIDDYVRYLDALHAHILAQVDLNAVREIVALGFSQGAATAARWAALGQAHLDRLILWGAGPPPDLDLESAAERLRGLRLTRVAGAADAGDGPAAAARDAERLREHGIPLRVITFPGGHRLDVGVLAELAKG